MGINCTPILLTCSFSLRKQGHFKKKLTRTSNFTFRYIKSLVISVGQIYSIELKIKNVTNTATSASYLDIYMETDTAGLIGNDTSRRNKISIFSLRIFNLFNGYSNIPTAFVYEVCISRLIFQNVWCLSGFIEGCC